MELSKEFDAVLMLTWSDWKNEPRSNRYHYATRFSSTLPVLFFQHLNTPRTGISIESSGFVNIDIVNVNFGLNDQDIQNIILFLNARGIKRPLLWIYDPINYNKLINALPKAFRVYHATEDYLTVTNGWNQGMKLFAKSLTNLLSTVDFVVFVSHGIVKPYYELGSYRGPSVVIENGCDAEYFIEKVVKSRSKSLVASKPIAIFQGGINQRLDYELILALVKEMPDWEFHFCGASIESNSWNLILTQKNVKYFGPVSPEVFTQKMIESTVGIIPFIQDQWIRNSLPLKAYEYVACGLPVVTVPITAFEKVDVITTASGVAEFEAAIRKAAKTRFDPKLLQRRKEVALNNSYNSRFQFMSQKLLAAKAQIAMSKKRLRVAVLYDSVVSMHVGTIYEHLSAFEKYSKHMITYIPASSSFWRRSSHIDLSIFDAVILHYSIKLSVSDHLSNIVARSLEFYNGLKLLFIQDESEGTEIARSWMDRLKFDIVYTCIQKECLELIYPSKRYPSVEFLPTLTGYVPESEEIAKYSKPFSERKVFIAYRGNKLHAVYGDHGYEKYQIGIQMKKIAEELGLAVDIEVDDSKRIYGSAWYEFLGSARATLGTENGANIYEGRVLMNQISPKIFEAILLRTALILFEGSYSDVVRPYEHYIPLKKDFSNIDDVILKLKDNEYVKKLTEQAYNDIVASGKYSYNNFITGIDSDISSRLFRTSTKILVNGPMLVVESDGSFKQALPSLPVGLVNGKHPLGVPMSLNILAMHDLNQSMKKLFRSILTIQYRILRLIWRLLPSALRTKVRIQGRNILTKMTARYNL